MKLSKKAHGLLQIAIDEMITQLQEADDDLLGYYGATPETRDEVINEYYTISAVIDGAFIKDHADTLTCSLCGKEADELTQRADMTLGTDDPVWLCDDCNQ